MSAYVARRAKPYLPERHSYSKGRAMTDGMTNIPHRFSGEEIMLTWSLTFLILGLIAGVFGLSGIAGAATQIAWILFVIFLVLYVISIFSGRRTPPVKGKLLQ